MINRYLILTFAFLCGVNLCWASQVAEVAKEEILVYADDTTQVPIGKLSAGAKVHIAHKTRRGGTVIPAYVSGKLVYLKTEDIILHTEGSKISEHRIDDEAEEKAVELGRYKYLTFTYHKMDLGKRWRKFAARVNDEQQDYFSNYVFSMEYRDPKIRYFGSGGIGYYLYQQHTYSFEGLSAEFSAGYIPWQWKFISYEVMLTGIFSGAWRFQSRDEDGDWVRDKIMAWGYMLGAQLKFFPYDQFSATLGWSYKYIFMRLKKVYVYLEDDSESKIYTSVPRIGGASFYLGFTYRF